MSDWKLVSRTATLEVHRTGWRGVVDALRSLITGRPRLTVPQDVTFSVWIKAPQGQEVHMELIQSQLGGGE